ncbi:hypothetical protein [Aliigemmobacter aestuarii]|nr:hypothetical protein [Gemmobacter aestuarii]
MSNIVRATMAIGLVAFISACAPKMEEPTYVETPVTTEPTYTGKYN